MGRIVNLAIAICLITAINFHATGQGTLDVETFEADANGATTGFSFWNNVTGDDEDWQVESPNVGNSGGTGPLNGSGHSKYLYIETSGTDETTAGNEFWLVSDAINPNTHPISTVQFDYHMYGATINALTLEYSITGTADEDFKSIWSRVGQQQTSETQAYITATVDFYGIPVTYLRFKGVDGTDYRGDIAIDNITVSYGTPPIDVETFEADANAATSGFTFWNNVSGDQSNWQVESPNVTNSGNTGPLNGLNHSKYLYTEASSPRVAGDEYWLVSDAINASSNSITKLFFQYHMWDNNSGQIGTLSVEFSTTGTADGDFTPVWSVTGQQQSGEAEPYKDQVLDFSGIPVTYLRFKAVQGGDYRGDISIDNIAVYSGAPAEAIPTLSQWGLIILTLLVLGVCSVAIWNRQHEHGYQVAIAS